MHIPSSHFPTRQTRHSGHAHPAALQLALFAVPLLLVLDGVFSGSITSLAIGVIGLVAARGIGRFVR